MYPPLQSHGLKVKKWVPPAPTRFISYTEEDESWADYCGLGHFIDAPAPWYDVLHEDGDTVMGWVKWNPCVSFFRLGIPIVDRMRTWTQRTLDDQVYYSVIELTRRTCYRDDGRVRFFEAWSMDHQDFGDLVKYGRAAIRPSDIRKLTKCVN